MKKFLLFICFTAFCFGFSQSKDINKKQALEAFKNSELRKMEKIKISDFDKIYRTAVCVKKNYGDKKMYPNSTKLKSMPIFNNKNKTNNNAIFSIYGYDLDLPSKDDFGNKTKCFN